MASTLKGTVRSAADAVRFGGQVPSFYLDPTNFIGSSLPVAAGGTGGTTLQTARDSLNLYSQNEISLLNPIRKNFKDSELKNIIKKAMFEKSKDGWEAYKINSD